MNAPSDTARPIPDPRPQHGTRKRIKKCPAGNVVTCYKEYYATFTNL
jgi:hypothetical protein